MSLVTSGISSPRVAPIDIAVTPGSTKGRFDSTGPPMNSRIAPLDDRRDGDHLKIPRIEPRRPWRPVQLPTHPETARPPQPDRVRGEALRRAGNGRTSESETPSTRPDQLISTSRTPGEPQCAFLACG